MGTYKKAIELNENYYEAYFNKGISETFIIGNCLKMLNSYDQAIELYNRSIKLNPEYFEAFNNRGTVTTFF